MQVRPPPPRDRHPPPSRHRPRATVAPPPGNRSGHLPGAASRHRSTTAPPPPPNRLAPSPPRRLPPPPRHSLAFSANARVVELVRHGRLKSDCPSGMRVRVPPRVSVPIVGRAILQNRN